MTSIIYEFETVNKIRHIDTCTVIIPRLAFLVGFAVISATPSMAGGTLEEKCDQSIVSEV